MIVLAAPALRHIKRGEKRWLQAAHFSDPRKEARGHAVERFADAPYAILTARIHIAEYAQDPFTAIRSRRKSVDMKARIVLTP